MVSQVSSYISKYFRHKSNPLYVQYTFSEKVCANYACDSE